MKIKVGLIGFGRMGRFYLKEMHAGDIRSLNLASPSV